MNPVTVRLFGINQHKVVTKFYDMCPSTSSTAVGIFTAINTAMMKITLHEAIVFLYLLRILP